MITWRWISWFYVRGKRVVPLPRTSTPKPYVMLQLGAAFEA